MTAESQTPGTIAPLPVWAYWLCVALCAVRPSSLPNQILTIQAGPAMVYEELCNIDDSLLPAAHASNALIAWWAAGNFYLGAIPYGRSVTRRIQPAMPA